MRDLLVICLVDNACILHMDDGQCQAQYDNSEHKKKRDKFKIVIKQADKELEDLLFVRSFF